MSTEGAKLGMDVKVRWRRAPARRAAWASPPLSSGWRAWPAAVGVAGIPRGIAISMMGWAAVDGEVELRSDWLGVYFLPFQPFWVLRAAAFTP